MPIFFMFAVPLQANYRNTKHMTRPIRQAMGSTYGGPATKNIGFLGLRG
jgi:hypothetical protein